MSLNPQLSTLFLKKPLEWLAQPFQKETPPTDASQLDGRFLGGTAQLPALVSWGQSGTPFALHSGSRMGQKFEASRRHNRMLLPKFRFYDEKGQNESVSE